jgi:hypothetical protein
MNEVEIDPEGPFSPYYTFICHRKDCACSTGQRREMHVTTLECCPNCYGPITRGVLFRHTARMAQLLRDATDTGL